MLHELIIERFALIDHIHLRLAPGFNVFTGETGAGKSIILDAIGVLLGNRGSAELIQKGSDSALVEASFSMNEATRRVVDPLLDEWGIAAEDAGLLLSRELYRTGRTVCRINGRLATVQMLRQLGVFLIQQHGQHDHQGLLRPDEQLRALDLYGKHSDLCQRVKDLYHQFMVCKEAYENSQMDEQSRVQRLDLLNFQIGEIQEAKLQVGEEDELREQRRRLQYVDKIKSALEAARVALDGTDRSLGAVGLLADAQREVAAATAYDEELNEAAEMLQSAQVYADEASRLLVKKLDGQLDDPTELEQIESRLVQIRGLERKYGSTVDEVLAYLERAEAERQSLLNHETRGQQLLDDMERAERELAAAAAALHAAREQAASRFAEEVADVLRQLNMPYAQLHVDLLARTDAEGRSKYSEQGMDQIQFLFSANRGEDPKPLQKVASGGELSRTLLALKSVLANVDDLETLIFDEIDTGISGGAAQAVAEHMVRIAQSRQVLCVTHSASLAAAATTHFAIAKRELEDRAVTSVTKLDETGRVEEIARLLGAGIAEEAALGHAKAMLATLADSPQSSV